MTAGRGQPPRRLAPYRRVPPPGSTPPEGGPPRGLSAALSRAVVWLRWPIVLAWIAGTAFAVYSLPSIGGSGGLALTGLVPEDAPALGVERRSVELFRAPLLARTVLVQRDPDGLSADAQARVLSRAATTAREPARVAPLAIALPVINQRALLPFAGEDGTTAITYFFFPPDVTLVDQEQAAQRYLALEPPRPDDAVVGITGAAPANLAQGRAIEDALPLVELATVVLIALVMAIAFRSLLAPLVTLATAGAALVVTRNLGAYAGEVTGVSVPGEVEPLVVVLLLAIVTDYAIFFLSAMRPRLAAGEGRVRAATVTTARVAPIVVAAGLTIAACTAALVAGQLEFFRALGPGLALTAIVGMLAAVTLLPALLAIFGRALYWPHMPRPGVDSVEEGTPPAWRMWLARVSTRRAVALPVALLCLGGLAAATYFLPRTTLGVTLIRGLGEDSTEQRAAKAVAAGIAPGAVAPTELLVQAPGVGDPALLGRVAGLVDREPGVAGVIGPGGTIGAERLEVFVTPDRGAARFAVILDSDPQAARAITDLRRLQRRLPALLAEAGLPAGAQAGLAGDTALAAETIDAIRDDGLRVGLAAAAIGFVLLALFLRALVAPIYLLAVSVAALAAALGLTTLIAQELLGIPDLTYYVPFAAAILLFALGSDYNIFVVGRIWEEARNRPLKEAIAVSVPRSGKALNAAGFTLAASFGLLALVPLDSFRELAIVMALGVLIDTLVVRPFLVPALVAIVGRASGWPGRRLRKGPAALAQAPAPGLAAPAGPER